MSMSDWNDFKRLFDRKVREELGPGHWSEFNRKSLRVVEYDEDREFNERTIYYEDFSVADWLRDRPDPVEFAEKICSKILSE